MLTVLRRHHLSEAAGLAMLYGVGVLLVTALVVAASGGLIFAALAIGAAAFVAILSVLGAERTGILFLVGAYFTAPFYKGLAPNPEAPVTTTDALLAVGLFLLLPRLLRGRVRLPLLYIGGVSVVFCAGLISSALSSAPVISFLALAFWMVVMVAIPVSFALWKPSGRTIDLLAAAFIAGQMFSLAVGAALGKSAEGRQFGLSTHPNYLAQGGMLSIALLLYLGHRYWRRSWTYTLAILTAGAVCAASVQLSGSRAATVVVAVLVLMVPVVERSALMGFAMAIVGALGLVTFSLLVELAAPGSALARLGGDTSTTFANSARDVGREAGLDRFAAHPLTGDGLIDLFDIHNNFIEVAVAVGFFGLVGYLLVMASFAHPLFGHSEYRRLAYTTWGYIGFGATVPSLYDRSIWLAVGLSVVAMIGLGRSESDGGSELAPHPEGRLPTPLAPWATNGDRRVAWKTAAPVSHLDPRRIP